MALPEDDTGDWRQREGTECLGEPRPDRTARRERHRNPGRICTSPMSQSLRSYPAGRACSAGRRSPLRYWAPGHGAPGPGTPRWIASRSQANRPRNKADLDRYGRMRWTSAPEQETNQKLAFVSPGKPGSVFSSFPQTVQNPWCRVA